ncbi:hypothetical protein [Virgibacillus litoralis]|uniref:Uncharacterized protein n=1 Tax=Virgibacillus litoralis TaxID=578221 RepID=A0ABS4HGE2_9BACI|nr:hypothetical protein [Virgibacillus litoralis]MBP1949898.1 hypothetical protein [Virgibacillus litoralis]
MKFYKITGIVFIIMSGLIYTLEKGFSLLSTSIVRAGFFSGAKTGGVPEIEASGFFGNLYVPLFLILGLLFIIYGFLKK